MSIHIEKLNRIALLALTTLCILWTHTGTVEAQDQPENLPKGYRYIGQYQLKSKVRVENGVSQPVVISPLVYRVFSDGIDVRVYCKTAGEDNYTVYDIYRSDGVGVVKSDGELELVAGVQAYSTKGRMLRQISVTRKSLTMVKTPPRSHRVIITRAMAIAASDESKTADK